MKKLTALLLVSIVLAAILIGCIDKTDNKSIESYRPTELPEGITETSFTIIAPNDPGFPTTEPSIVNVTSAYYTSEKAPGRIMLGVIECSTEKEAEELFERLTNESRAGKLGRVDGRFIIGLTWENSGFDEDAGFIFSHV